MNPHTLRISPVKQSGVRRHAEAAAQRFANSFHRLLMSAFKADRQVVMFLLTIKVNAECQILRGLEEVELFLQKKCIRAEVNVLSAGDQAFDDPEFAGGAMARRRES